MPERARTQSVQDVKSVLKDLGQKLPGAGGVEGEEETTDDEGGGNGDEDKQAGAAGCCTGTAKPAAAATLKYGDENELSHGEETRSAPPSRWAIRTKRRIRARNPLRKRAITDVVLLLVRGVVLSTVSILVLVPTVCGCRLVPRRGRGYAVSTMRTSS
jgi:hypothetical protein